MLYDGRNCSFMCCRPYNYSWSGWESDSLGPICFTTELWIAQNAPSIFFITINAFLQMRE